MPASVAPDRPAVDGSTRVVYAALAGNVAIALAKFAAYGISGSSAMLTEAIHSLVDSTDQVLLLIGQLAPAVMDEIKRQLSAEARIEKVVDIATLHLGPRAVLVALTLSFASDLTLADLRRAIRELTLALKQADQRIAYVYVRPAPEPESRYTPGFTETR